MEISKAVKDGQAIYSRSVLSIYDLWVLGISNSFIWKCPTKFILDYFNVHVSSNHLDVGVGTGYYLDKGKFPELSPRVGLMDLNSNSLNESAKRISRYQPEKYRVNVLDEIRLDIEPYDSVSLNYLFHCLPGKLEEKLKVLDNLAPYVKRNGVVFGSTIVSNAANTSSLAKKLMSIYNRKGIFSNSTDTSEALENYLTTNYDEFEIMKQGCVVLFSAKGRRI